MNNVNIFLVVIGLFLLFKLKEGFVNMNNLDAFDYHWGNHDNPKLDYKPKKTSELVANCDEKRGVCIKY